MVLSDPMLVYRDETTGEERVTVTPLSCELCPCPAVTTCEGCGMDLCRDDSQRKGGLLLCPFCAAFGVPHDEGED